MNMKKIAAIVALLVFFGAHFEESAFARAGRSGSFGGRSSFGSKGSRTYSAPARPAPSQNQYQSNQAQRPTPSMPQQSPFGGFMRSMAGGLLGGFVGALLFRSLGFGGIGGGMGGFGGIGLFDILLLGLGIFIIYKLVKSKRQATVPSYGADRGYDQGYHYQPPVRDIPPVSPPTDDRVTGISQIRQFDPSFDERRFKETATDIFFKVQAAWMNRDIESVRKLFAPEIYEIMRSDVAQMKTEGRINRLENIAMRGADITEAWQEHGKDYVTVELNANVLDYMTDESGTVVEGSKTEPVKFVEYWTYVRPIGSGAWQLTAIQQAD